MPYENLWIIKVPERIARFSACIAVCIYRVCMYREGAKNRLLYSTGFIYIQVRGRGQCHNYRCEGSKVTCIGSEIAHMAEYNLEDEDTEQKHGKETLLLIQQHHISPTSPFCF